MMYYINATNSLAYYNYIAKKLVNSLPQIELAYKLCVGSELCFGRNGQLYTLTT